MPGFITGAELIRASHRPSISSGYKLGEKSAMVRKALVLVSLIAAIASPAYGEIGRIKTTLGTASIQRGADHIKAATGQELLPGDWLETGKDGRMSLTFVDNTRWSVGPDSRIALTKFDYDPTSQHGSFVAQIERGSIAVVSGRITKTRCDPVPESSCGAQIKTPDGDVSPHGTRFIIVVRK
jgi:hypothetical protein